MVNFKKQVKCITVGCTLHAEQDSVFCVDCLERKSKPKPLQKNNPEGFNKHKSNPKPKEAALSDIEAFSRLSPEQQKEWLGSEGNALWREMKDILPRKRRFTMFKNLYEAKHFGWKVE